MMNNPSDQTFDSRLGSIDHYRAYPAMLPYVGGNYAHPSHKKLLLVGESNYLPKESVIHKDANAWYAGTQASLSDEEVAWINNRELLEGEWNNSGHRIYREIDRCLSYVNSSKDERAVSHAAYMNAFQRPANEGASLKHCCTQADVTTSARVLNHAISTLEPDVVIFVSKYAWDTLHDRIERNPKAYFDFVCHPASPFWWRRRSYPYGFEKFRSLLKTHYARGGTIG